MSDESKTHYSSFAGVVAWSGGEMILRQGQSIDEDHPLYQERPELFRGLAPANDLPTHAPTGTVQMNMQPPGGSRPVRVPRGATPKVTNGEGGSDQ